MTYDRSTGTFDLVAHLKAQAEWSNDTFGPGSRTAAVIDHIRKELEEVEAVPADLSEWIDVATLALDGALRAGWGPHIVADALGAKLAKNKARVWPDWRTMPADKAIEHDRAHEGGTRMSLFEQLDDEQKRAMIRTGRARAARFFAAAWLYAASALVVTAAGAWGWYALIKAIAS